MPRALAPLRYLLLESPEKRSSSNPERVDHWTASVTASLLSISKDWRAASLVRRRWCFAVRCIAWLRMLSGKSQRRFCPFAAPYLVLLRLHASYVDTCCRLFYTLNAETVLVINERLRALEEGPLAHVPTELLELWRRQAAVDLTLPAIDLALMHQHISIPFHPSCRAEERSEGILLSRDRVGPSEPWDVRLSATGVLRNLRLPIVMSSVSGAFRALRLSAGERPPTSLSRGDQKASLGSPMQLHVPRVEGYATGAQPVEGTLRQEQRDYRESQLRQLPTKIKEYVSGPAPEKNGAGDDLHDGRETDGEPFEWTNDPASALRGAAEAVGGHRVICSFSFAELGFCLEHKPPGSGAVGCRERWLLTRATKLHANPTGLQNLQREEATEWRCCPERVSFRGPADRHSLSGTVGKVERKRFGRLRGSPAQQLGSWKNFLPRFSSGRGRLQEERGRTNNVDSRLRTPTFTEDKGIDILLFGVAFHALVAYGHSRGSAGLLTLSPRFGEPAMASPPAGSSTCFETAVDAKAETAVEDQTCEGCSLDQSTVSAAHWKLRVVNMYWGPTTRQWSKPVAVLTLVPH